VFSGRVLCVEMITIPFESNQVCCVSECDREATKNRRPWPTGVCCVKENNIKNKHNIFFTYRTEKPIPVAARSKAWVCDRSLAEIMGSNPNGGHGCLSVVFCQVEISCDGLITRTEESYRVWVCLSVIVNPRQ